MRHSSSMSSISKAGSLFTFLCEMTRSIQNSLSILIATLTARSSRSCSCERVQVSMSLARVKSPLSASVTRSLLRLVVATLQLMSSWSNTLLLSLKELSAKTPRFKSLLRKSAFRDKCTIGCNRASVILFLQSGLLHQRARLALETNKVKSLPKMLGVRMV